MLSKKLWPLSLLVAAVCGLSILPDARAQEPVLVVYDVTDLLRPIRHFPAPRLGLAEEGVTLTPAEEASEEPLWTAQELAALIEEVVRAADSNATVRAVPGAHGVLAVLASSLQHGQIETALNTLRARPSRAHPTYSIEAQLWTLERAELTALGVKIGVSSARSQILDHAPVERALAELPPGRQLLAPRLTTLARQVASLAMLSEVAYVADYEIHDAVADPVVQTFKEGFVLEACARPVRGSERVRLRWSAQRCGAERPFPTITVEGVGTVELPDVQIRAREGIHSLGPQQCLVIAGGLDVPQASAVDALRDALTVLILTVVAAPEASEGDG